MIAVDLDLPLPIEEQLCRQLRTLIARGELRSGDPLPSVRQLAGDLGVHFNTVARAYRKLRDEGLLRVGLGRRAVVRADRASAGSPTLISEQLRHLLAQARLAGMNEREIRRVIDAELKETR